jgi:hypothetical protein
MSVIAGVATRIYDLTVAEKVRWSAEVVDASYKFECDGLIFRISRVATPAEPESYRLLLEENGEEVASETRRELRELFIQARNRSTDTEKKLKRIESVLDRMLAEV